MSQLSRFPLVLLAACLWIVTTVRAADETTYPIVIKHAFGTTTIAKKPERVAAVAWANHEVPLALGIVPVGFAAANFGDDDGDGLLPWVAEKLKELGGEKPVLFDEGDGIVDDLVGGLLVGDIDRHIDGGIFGGRLNAGIGLLRVPAVGNGDFGDRRVARELQRLGLSDTGQQRGDDGACKQEFHSMVSSMGVGGQQAIAQLS